MKQLNLTQKEINDLTDTKILSSKTYDVVSSKTINKLVGIVIAILLLILLLLYLGSLFV